MYTYTYTYIHIYTYQATRRGSTHVAGGTRQTTPFACHSPSCTYFLQTSFPPNCCAPTGIYLYVCIHIYVYIYVYMYTHIYMYIHIYIYVLDRQRLLLVILPHVLTFYRRHSRQTAALLQVYICICIYMYIYMSVCLYTYVYIYIYICIYIYTYMYSTDNTFRLSFFFVFSLFTFPSFPPNCCTHTGIHICMYIYINLYVYIHIYRIIYTYIYIVTRQTTPFACHSSLLHAYRYTSIYNDVIPAKVLHSYRYSYTVQCR